MPHQRSGPPAPEATLPGEIRAEPGAGLLLDITGPGGCGKTPELEAAARAYAAAGVPVVRELPADRSAGLAGAAVLIDDAHLLEEAGLTWLSRLARSPGQRLLVAHRRWPASPALTTLGTALTAHRAPVVLGHLDRPAIADRVGELLGTPCPELLARLMYEQTAGLPVLLEQLVVGLRDSGQLSADAVRQLAPRTRLDVPAGVREQLRYVIEGLPAEVRDVLFAATLSTGSDTETLSQLLEADDAAIDRALQAAQATGLMTDHGLVVPLVGRLLLRLTPAAYTNRICDRLAGLQLNRGGSMLPVGQALLRTSARGPRVAGVLLAAGQEALGSAPDLASRLLAAAATAGAQSPALLAGRADAAARGGRLDEALRLADEALIDEAQRNEPRGDQTWGDETRAEEHAAERARALGITAAVLAHRGLLGRAAELYHLTDTPDGADYPLIAVPVLAGIGALGEAQKVLAGCDGHAESTPTLLSGVESLIAHGIEESISGSSVAALSQLSRAASLLESAGSTPLLPDTPAALAALVATHAGEFPAAAAILRRAISARQGGRLAATRHRLLLGFLAMTRGYTGDAHALLTAAGADRSGLEPRDELFAAAIAVGLARREGDLSALQRGWSRAREALLQHPVDLYVLLPLGELAVAAARRGEQWWIEPHLRQADTLLEQLGEPQLWRVPLDWYGVHAAIAAESPQEARRHVSALAEAATASPYAAVLAGAAACWMRVLAGAADVDEVVATARQLAGAGVGAEGSRLAGQAAIRATDRKAMAVLLECARAVRPGVSPGAGEAAPATARHGADAMAPRDTAAPAPGQPPAVNGHERAETVLPDVTLSAREQEIARRVLTGLTYKEIGAQLFISAKTVEHHMARIRRRLGAQSRRELFGQLQVMLSLD
ncbi:MAG TPA: helix-turn-helix transcriptional regulator [Streptosporangiaceae bacterium]|nr:helix-turn-helix transcriptional regulator [Streptosporangiaceae bacterium]